MNNMRQAEQTYSQAIELAPMNERARSRRGSFYAELGQWEAAAMDFGKASELKGDYPVVWYCLALVRLHLGDRDGHRSACAAMLQGCGESPKGDAGDWIIWTCVLAPSTLADWGPVLALGEKNRAADPKNCDKLQLLGALLYRAGRFEEAAQRLTEAEAAFPDTREPRSSILHNWLFQAMTRHRLGRADEAKGWLDKAVNEMDRPKDRAIAWSRRLTLQLLRREAEELLGVKEKKN
jgi:tetratricopeptide (TPR) repeat protein